MPTESFEPILDRDAAIVLAKPIIDLASPILKEAVNYATNAFARCNSSKKGSLEEAYPVLASYLHVIQMIDSIEVLVSNGCAAPAELLLRSAFEGKLTIEYIFEKRNKSKKRAFAWLGMRVIDEIKLYERFSSSPSDDKDFQTIYKNEKLSKLLKAPSPTDISEGINKLKTNLEKPDYAEVQSEYQKYRTTNRAYPEWYSLYDGPKNLRKLAQHLHQGSIYEVLYSSWSRMSHAVDSAHVSFPMKNGSSILAHIRNPLRIPSIAGMALSFLLEITRLMLQEYRSGEHVSFHRWWYSEIKEKHIALTRFEISGLDWYYKTFIEKSIKDEEKEAEE